MNHADQLTSYQRAAETKRQRTINEIVGASAIEFYRNGYRAATVKAIAEHTTRSIPTFYNVAERKSRVGLMVIDSTFQGMRAAKAQGSFSERYTLATAIRELAHATEPFSDVQYALVEELTLGLSPLRESLPSVAAAFDGAVSSMVADGELPGNTDVVATTDRTIALVGSLLVVPGLETTVRDELVDAYLAALTRGDAQSSRP